MLDLIWFRFFWLELEESVWLLQAIIGSVWFGLVLFGLNWLD